jgi:gluconate 2-dehydrogenase gamma chain
MLTVLGVLASPKYGGNYQASGWKMMGFVDRHAFSPPFGYYDREYTGFVPYPVKS